RIKNGPSMSSTGDTFHLELRRSCCEHPPVDSRVIHVDATFKHEFFDVARAQRGGDIPADAQQNNVLWEMGPFESTALKHLPLENQILMVSQRIPCGNISV